MGDLAGEPLLDVLEEAETARVIAAAPGLGRYRFSHALIRETLYEGMPAARRIRLHRQVGEALEGLYAAHPEPHLAALAHHFVQAAPVGGSGKAVAYARRAGDRALALLAFEEATGHYARALELLDLHGAADGPDGGELLLALGEARMRAGLAPAARETFARAAAVARHQHAPERLARAALGYGGAGPEIGIVDAHLVGLLEEALAALGDADSPLTVRVLGRLAMELAMDFSRAVPPERRAALSTAALAMARRLGDPAALAAALNARHVALWEPENIAERLAICAELQRVAELAGDAELALLGHTWRIPDLLETGDIAAVRRRSRPMSGWRRSCASRSTSGTRPACGHTWPASTGSSRRRRNTRAGCWRSPSGRATGGRR